jgi:hypothetical protein
MKHSIILKVGENLIYQCAPDSKPAQANADGMKDYMFWQKSLQSILIKPEDTKSFEDYITPEKLSVGCPIPFEVIEITEDKIANKKYAKINTKVVFNKETNKIVSIGFSCKICDAVQDVDASNYDATFKVCNACIGALKDYVLSKRDVNLLEN